MVIRTGDRTLFGAMTSAIAGEAVETSFTKGVNAVSWVLIPFTPLGSALGFTALPAAYFAYLLPCILLYMVLTTGLKKAYVRHYGELL